jgi:hypothetical protein
MNTYQIFFGRSIPNGSTVSDLQWETFVSQQICHLFGGFTIQSATGYWKGQQEHTMVVTICTDDIRHIEALATEYRQLFRQDSVAILTLPPLSFV